MVEGHPMELVQKIILFAEVHVPMVDADDCLCRGLNGSSSSSQDLHYAAEVEMDSMVFEEVHQLVNILHGHGEKTTYPFRLGENVP